MATMRLNWAKTQVLAELRDPTLRPQTVAQRQGVSLRLLQRLFSAHGECLADFILEQRLQRCAEALRDPSKERRTITEIALSWGFGDSAGFSRAFRRRFGTTPRDWRAQVRR
jgi:AraC-like DNA-binding protein